MTEKEQRYFNKYNRTCDVSDDGCFLGGKWCATCMHCVGDHTWTGAGFEHNYCTMSRKGDA